MDFLESIIISFVLLKFNYKKFVLQLVAHLLISSTYLELTSSEINPINSDIGKFNNKTLFVGSTAIGRVQT